TVTRTGDVSTTFNGNATLPQGAGLRSNPAVAPQNRGLTTATENTGRSSQARTWEEGATGWRTNAQGQREVPALRFDNPNPNGNNFVRFDGVDPANPRVLIDRKWNVTTKADQVRKFREGPLEALR